MALAPKPFILQDAAPTAFKPRPVSIEGLVNITPQPAPAIDPVPADADAVAADLQSVVNALIAAGVFTAP